jgi:hypothetical protein
MQEREGTEEGETPEGIEAAARLGAELAARGAPSGDDETAAREAAWADVVGPDRAAWYVERFRRFNAREGAWAFTWNWVCVLFPLLWLLYRKMYGWAAALVLADALLAPLTAAAPGPAGLLSLAVMVALPLGGNWLYYRHVNGIVARSGRLGGTPEERRAYRRGTGGVSWVGPAVVVGLTVLVSLWAVSGAGPM